MIKNVKREKKDRVEYNGISFANDWEMEYYRDVLLPAQQEGIISGLKCQPYVILAESVRVFGKKLSVVKYITDFSFVSPCNKEIHIDVKGFATETAKLKRRLFYTFHPDKLLFWIVKSKVDGGWIEYERIKKKRRERKKIKEAKKNGPKRISGKK